MAIPKEQETLENKAAETTVAPASAETQTQPNAAQPTNPAAQSTSLSSSQVTATLNAKAPNYTDPTRVQAINDMYNANINATKNNLEASYNQNLSNLEANKENIAKQYQTQQNQAAVDYERQRRNFLESASSNGLNVGAGSQAQLAQNATYQKNRSGLLVAEADANASANRDIANLKIQYQSNINSAVAENDYKRAAALLDEYNQAYSMAMEKAQMQAQYGIFDGYASIYGADTANQMAEAWAIQNPVLAYSLGRIDATKYHTITGEWPPDAKRRGYGGGGGGDGGDSGDDGGDSGDDVTEDGLGNDGDESGGGDGVTTGAVLGATYAGTTVNSNGFSHKSGKFGGAGTTVNSNGFSHKSGKFGGGAPKKPLNTNIPLLSSSDRNNPPAKTSGNATSVGPYDYLTD